MMLFLVILAVILLLGLAFFLFLILSGGLAGPSRKLRSIQAKGAVSPREKERAATVTFGPPAVEPAPVHLFPEINQTKLQMVTSALAGSGFEAWMDGTLRNYHLPLFVRLLYNRKNRTVLEITCLPGDPVFQFFFYSILEDGQVICTTSLEDSPSSREIWGRRKWLEGEGVFFYQRWPPEKIYLCHKREVEKKHGEGNGPRDLLLEEFIELYRKQFR